MRKAQSISKIRILLLGVIVFATAIGLMKSAQVWAASAPRAQAVLKVDDTISPDENAAAPIGEKDGPTQITGVFAGTSVPGKMARPIINNWYPNLKKVYIKWATLSGVDGYQCVCQTYTGKTKSSKIIRNPYMSTIAFGNLNVSTTYRFRVRAYSKINGRTYWGAWSDYRYLVPAPGTFKLTGNTKNMYKISFRFSGVKGASAYQIYVSTKPFDEASYKLAATLPASRTSYTITKYNGSRINLNYSNYYIKIRPVKKVGRLVAIGVYKIWEVKRVVTW